MREAIKSVPVTQEDVDSLRKAFIHRSGMLSLLTEKASPTDRDYEVFAEKDNAYQALWTDIVTRYFGVSFTQGAYQWDCDFDTREVRIYL